MNLDYADIAVEGWC